MCKMRARVNVFIQSVYDLGSQSIMLRLHIRPMSMPNVIIFAGKLRIKLSGHTSVNVKCHLQNHLHWF